LEPQKLGWQGVRQHFGNRFFDLSGFVDRSVLRQTLFADPEVRRIVEQILHPLVRQEIHALSRQSLSAGAGQVSLLAEVPLLFEVGWQDDFDWVVVVYADNGCCARRIMRRDGVSLDEACQSLLIQFPLIEKAWLADSVIDNSGPLAQTLLQLHHLAQLWG
jgi:dephospho-CoA kinase